MKNLVCRALRVKGPSFIRSWQDQKYGKIPDNLVTAGGAFVVAGLPKSGNVWLTSLIANCLDLPVTKAPEKSHVFYTHKALTKRMLYDQDIYRGVVIVRDLRDIVVSLYHWLKTDDYLSYYKHGPHQVFNSLTDMYFEYYLRRFCNIPIRTLVDDYVTGGWPVVKYENLWDDAAKELQRLFAVWQIDVAPEKLARAVESNSIQNLRRLIEKSDLGTVDQTIRKDHFRQGGYGQYKREIPPHIVSDLERRFADYLTSWGYELTVDVGERSRDQVR